MSAKINEFVFKGIMANHAKRELESAGLLRMPSMTAEEKKDQDLFAAISASVRSASLQMQRCYRLLFVFENLVREFIVDTFTESDGADWFDKRATAAMRKRYEDRRAAEQKNQWHTGRNTHAVYYLDFGDLGLLIINHWAEITGLISRISFPTKPGCKAEFRKRSAHETSSLTPTRCPLKRAIALRCTCETG